MLLGGKLYGDGNRTVSDVAPIESATGGKLCFLCDEKYMSYLATTQASVVLVTAGLLGDNAPESNATVIAVENARGAMGQLLQKP